MDAVGLAAGCDLGNLAPVGRRMGELDQIVNAGFYRRGCPRFVFPADVPAQRVLGVQVVRRTVLVERIHKVCDREGHDPCGIILAFYKRIVLPGNTCLCSILHLTAIHVLVAVLPEAVDAGDGDKAGQRIEDFVLRGFVDLRGGVALDFEGHFVAYRDCPFVSRPVIDQREHLLADFTLFKLMGAVRRIVRRTNRLLGILGNIRGRTNCDIAGIARFFTAFYLTDRVGGSVVALQQRKANRLMLLICRAFDIHTTGIKFINVVRRRGLGRVKLRGGGAGSVDDGLVPHVACLLDLPSAVRVLKRKARGLVCNSRMRFAAVIHNCACGVHIRIVLQSIRLDRDRAGVVYDRADIIGACNHVRIQRSVFRILCRAVNLNIRLVVDILRLRGGSFRLLLLPDGVEGGVLGDGDRAVRLILSIPNLRRRPALELIVFSGRGRGQDRKRRAAGAALRSLLVRCTLAAVGVVGQGVGDFGVRVLRDQIDRRALVAGGRIFQVEAPSLRVRLCFLAPANDLIAAVHRRSVRSCLDIADGDRVVVVGVVAVRRRVLAYKLRLFRRAVIVADAAELIADIKNGEPYIDLMAGILCRHRRHRQHAEYHNQN